MYDIMETGTYRNDIRVNSDGVTVMPEEIHAFDQHHDVDPKLFVKAFNKYMNEHDGEMPVFRVSYSKRDGTGAKHYSEYHHIIIMASAFDLVQQELDDFMPFHSFQSYKSYNMNRFSMDKSVRLGTKRIASYCILLYLLKDEIDLDGFRDTIQHTYRSGYSDYILEIAKIMGEHHRYVWSKCELESSERPYFKWERNSHLEMESINKEIQKKNQAGTGKWRDNEVGPLIWKVRTAARYAALIEAGINPLRAGYWANGGYSEIDSRYLSRLESGELHDSTAILWADHGYDGDYASRWMGAGFSPEEADRWYERGVLHPEDAIKMQKMSPNSWIKAW